jgi:hypothetical protein
MKRELSSWGYNWATLSLGDTNSRTSFSRLVVEGKADDFVVKKLLLRNPKK